MKDKQADPSELELDEDEAASEGQIWFGSPTTQRLYREARTQALTALDVLLGKCSVSIDPTVRAAHAAYMQTKGFMQKMQEAGGKDATVKLP